MKKSGLDKVCYCGQEFYATPGALKKGHGKYCSTKCSMNSLWSDPGYRKRQSKSHKGYMPTNIQQLRIEVDYYEHTDKD